MNGVAAGLRAIGAALGDVFSPRLFPLALACLAVAAAASFAAGWAAFHYLLPLVPEGQGWMAWLWNAAEALGGVLIVLLALVLSPAISMVVGGALFDVAAGRVEQNVLPQGSAPGRMVPILEGLGNGVKIALPALVMNLLAIPLYFVPVVNALTFIGLNGYLMGREYFLLAGVRRFSWREAQSLRKRAPLSVFLIGVACSFVPFIAPLVGAAAMTRHVNWAAKRHTERLR